MSKEPTRQQLSSRLAYNARTPAFLQKMQRQFGGGRRDEEEEDEYEYDESGRPPIPRRPTIPERPEGEAGSADEDDVDEGPQIVVLREGKHLSEREVENEKRKAKGLSPLPDSKEEIGEPVSLKPGTAAVPSTAMKPQAKSLSFSSSKLNSGSATTSKKRKVLGDGNDEESAVKPAKTAKKSKKPQKKLLSFDDA